MGTLQRPADRVLPARPVAERVAGTDRGDGQLHQPGDRRAAQRGARGPGRRDRVRARSRDRDPADGRGPEHAAGRIRRGPRAYEHGQRDETGPGLVSPRRRHARSDHYRRQRERRPCGPTGSSAGRRRGGNRRRPDSLARARRSRRRKSDDPLRRSPLSAVRSARGLEQYGRPGPRAAARRRPPDRGAQGRRPRTSAHRTNDHARAGQTGLLDPRGDRTARVLHLRSPLRAQRCRVGHVAAEQHGHGVYARARQRAGAVDRGPGESRRVRLLGRAAAVHEPRSHAAQHAARRAV